VAGATMADLWQRFDRAANPLHPEPLDLNSA
jgi:hypothetical protein